MIMKVKAWMRRNYLTDDLFVWAIVVSAWIAAILVAIL